MSTYFNFQISHDLFSGINSCREEDIKMWQLQSTLLDILNQHDLDKDRIISIFEDDMFESLCQELVIYEADFNAIIENAGFADEDPFLAFKDFIYEHELVEFLELIGE